MRRWESTISQERLITTNLSGPDIREMGNCFMTMVSFYNDEDHYVLLILKMLLQRGTG